MARSKLPAIALAGSADEVEARFYEALRRADIERLMATWADDDEIVCIHPGGTRAVGAAAIRASFEAMFEHGGIAVRPEQVRRLQQLGSALHHLVERIETAGAGGMQTHWVLASNFYVKTALGWRLAAHHASPGMTQEPEAPGLSAPGSWPSTLH